MPPTRPAPPPADCEPVYLPTTRETGFLPDLDAHPRRAARAHGGVLSSPRRPTRKARSPTEAYLEAARRTLARRFGFLVFADECYCGDLSQRATRRPACSKLSGPDFANVVVFHSLSKRSNLPGLRVGFAAGDRNFLARFVELRNVAAPQVPVPAQDVAIAAYADEAHVEENRRALCAEVRSRRSDHRRPLRLQAAGRRLLPVARRHRSGGGDEAAALKLWREGGPARQSRAIICARDRRRRPQSRHGLSSASRSCRTREITAEALHRLVAVLG